MLKIYATFEASKINKAVSMTKKTKMIIKSEKIEVANRLNDFGLGREDAAKICEGALHGRNLTSGLQPKTAEGLLKYIFGVEALREVLLSSNAVEYEIFSKSNIEGVFDPINGRKVMFQMVDQACGANDPQPKSKIGDGKKRLIEESRSGFLFPEWEEEERRREARIEALSAAECWYFIMSIDSNDVVCCELSRPESVDDEKFDGFHERIQIFKYGEFKPSGNYQHSQDDDDDAFEIKPTILKK